MEIKELNEPNFLSKAQNINKVDPDSYLKLIQSVGSTKFEEIVYEWVWGCMRNRYQKVAYIGGPNDKGRDIIGYIDYKNDIWEGYQCKNYKDKLTPSDLWPEIGKLCYNCFRKELNIPKKYFFISPFGVSAAVNDLLRNPSKLKEGLIKNWDKSCKTKLIHETKISLEGDLRNYVYNFDFSIFDSIDPQDFLDEYTKTRFFTRRFGILTIPRPEPKPAPAEPEEHEATYIRKILDAYEDYLSKHVDSHKNLEEYPELKEHFERQRNYFFSAEALKEFARDITDPQSNSFEKLKTELYEGIIDTIQEDAENGFVRLKKVLARADTLQFTDNSLSPHLSLMDKKGICHHLANEKEEVKWKM
jgi:hypothetical protein